MKKSLPYFTAGQFAGLHHLNKRTLHYYDDIGLFSPAYKAQNGYRYYTYRQSAELENILALRELGMSIDEIKNYLKYPGADAFLEIAAQKLQEIDAQIKRLQKLKFMMEEKQKALALCGQIYDGCIKTVCLPKRFFLLTPAAFQETALTDMAHVMAHLETAWACNACKTGCGSYLALDKVKQGHFQTYDGLFTQVNKPCKGSKVQVRPQGAYLCGYCIGSWDKIPALYQKMLDYAAANNLKLQGNCYEMGLNEFAISSEEEYVTQIEIQCESEV